jgi:NADH:ubiquinone oxidoreductase subunit 6 (subunit J)
MNTRTVTFRTFLSSVFFVMGLVVFAIGIPFMSANLNDLQMIKVILWMGFAAVVVAISTLGITLDSNEKRQEND